MTADFSQSGIRQFFPDGTILDGDTVIEQGPDCIAKDGKFVRWRWAEPDDASRGYE